MGRNRQTTSGFTVIACATVAAAVAYWILSAAQAPTLPFAIAQYVLLASLVVGGFGGLGFGGLGRVEALARRRVSR